MGNKFVTKYGNALKRVPVTEQGDILVEGKDKRLKKVSPLDIKYNGSSFGLILDLYKDLQETHKQFKNDLGHDIAKLISLLKEYGYNTPNVDLTSLIDDIEKLFIVKPTVEYYHFTFDKDGYITGMQSYGTLVSKMNDIPDDYNKGYWKIIDGEFVLDSDKFNQLYGGTL